MACGVVVSSMPASAGDVSFEQIIGFSKEGRYFGFEEFGIQDGSGFPYANLYLIDLENDRWVRGSPYRILKKSGRATLFAARSEARQLAQGLIRRLKLKTPARLLYARTIADPKGIGPVHMVSVPDWTDPRLASPRSFELILKTIDFGKTPTCPDGVKGFSLSIKQPKDQQETRFHEDNEPVSSRNCAADYRLSQVYIPDIFPLPKKGIALISVISRGFEGYDRRFIALPIPLPAE